MTINAIVFWVVLVIALGLFGYALTGRVRYLMLGRPEPRTDQVARRTGGFFVLVFGQKKLLKERVGIIHLFIFWGFIVIAFGTLQVIGEGVHKGFVLPWLGSQQWFFLLKDVLSVIVLIAVIVAAYIRYVVRPQRLKANLEAGIILTLIFLLVLTEFFYSGIGYALDQNAARSLAFVAVGISKLFGTDTGALEAVQRGLWWIHVLLLLGFLVYIPNSKHLHLIACPFNEWMRNLKPRGGQIYPMDLEDESIEEFGVSKIHGFTRKQLLDLYSCAECGRCQDNCPAFQSGKSLSSKQLMTKMRDHLVEQGPALLRQAKAEGEGEASATPAGATARQEPPAAPPKLIGDVITPEEIWACTTCYSCQEQCPVQNEHVNKIVDMRRNLVLMEGDFPKEANLAFRNMEVNGNPFGESALIRGDHLKKLGVPTLAEKPDAEILYWPGCAGSLDPRNQKVTTAFVSLAQAAGVSLATLGNEEKCCGDSARRLGNEYLFQSLAAMNIETLNGYGVKKIVTQCPHCLNTLKHEYPQFGGDYEVVHHTEFLNDLIASGRLKLSGASGKAVTYHDPCYLGRYNGVYDLPRQLLKNAGFDLVEMPRKKGKAFCCGGGGGRMWLEENEGERINNMRAAEVIGTGAGIAAVACPYCMTMLNDGINAHDAGEQVKVMDVAEVLQTMA